MNANQFALPRIGTKVSGGVYAGILTGKDGSLYALIKLDVKPPCKPATTPEDEGDDFLAWDEALAWATKQGGDLPTLAEAALLFTNVRNVLPDEAWTSEVGNDDVSLAWLAQFHDNDMTRFQKEARAEALAVQRVPLDTFVATAITPAIQRPLKTDMAVALEGAEACRAMLHAIASLGIVQIEPDPEMEGGDDGKRRDYVASDRFLTDAVERNWANPGFRLALSNCLLDEAADGGSFGWLGNVDAEWMLTDGGYRGKRELAEALGGAEPRRPALPPVEKMQKPREGKRVAKREPVAEAA